MPHQIASKSFSQKNAVPFFIVAQNHESRRQCSSSHQSYWNCRHSNILVKIMYRCCIWIICITYLPKLLRLGTRLGILISHYWDSLWMRMFENFLIPLINLIIHLHSSNVFIELEMMIGVPLYLECSFWWLLCHQHISTLDLQVFVATHVLTSYPCFIVSRQIFM